MAVDLAAKTLPALADKARNGHNPGANQAHWMVEDTATGKDTKQEFDTITDTTLATFEVYTRWHGWDDFEGDDGSGTTPGTYDFSIIRRELEYCAERGMPYMVRIDNRSFSGTANVMPGDLATAGYQIDTPGGGKTAIITSSVPRTRLEKLLKAICDEFGDHPYFAGIQCPGETSGMDDCPAAAYNFATAQAQLNALFKNCAEYCSYIYWCYGWNFLNGINGGVSDANLEAGWNAVFANLPTDGRVVLFTPDIVLPGSTFFGGVNERTYPCFTNTYYNRPGIDSTVQDHRRASSVQYVSHRHGPSWPNSKGDATAEAGANDKNSDGILDQHEQFIWARDRLELDIVMWSRVNFPANGTAVEFTFDRLHGENLFGSTYGDDVGAAMQPWAAAHNPNYRDGPA